MPGKSISVLAMTLACSVLAGCTSADTRAANNAAAAQLDFDQGRFTDAGIAIGRALALRDDNLDYWLLKAHIDAKAGNLQSAFSDYEYVIQLDHGNLEALQALCQLGTSAGPADRVDAYADQLLVLTPDAAPALTAKGNVALSAGNTDKAEEFANRVLAQAPQNVPALTLKAGVAIAREKFGDAAVLIERTLDLSANPVSRLQSLLSIYARAHDRPSYERTIRRLAQAAPNDPDILLTYADILYQDGQDDPARGVIQKVLAANPANAHVAAAALMVWLKAGPRALDPTRIMADAASLSSLMKADYAQFANETGHPDLAIAILSRSDRRDPASDNGNAQAAFAYALGLSGHRPEAMTRLNAMLADGRDPNQPWALLARARLLAASHDYANAVRDARLLVVNVPDDATAHLALVDILRASGSADLSESALREGLRAIPDSVQLATRLAALLAGRGDVDQAAEIAHNLARKAPMDLRAQQLAKSYGLSG